MYGGAQPATPGSHSGMCTSATSIAGPPSAVSAPTARPTAVPSNASHTPAADALSSAYASAAGAPPAQSAPDAQYCVAKHPTAHSTADGSAARVCCAPATSRCARALAAAASSDAYKPPMSAPATPKRGGTHTAVRSTPRAAAPAASGPTGSSSAMGTPPIDRAGAHNGCASYASTPKAP